MSYCEWILAEVRRYQIGERYKPSQLGLNPLDAASKWLAGPIAMKRAATISKQKKIAAKTARAESLAEERAKRAAMIPARTTSRAAKRAAEAKRHKKQEKMTSLKAMRPARLSQRGDA